MSPEVIEVDMSVHPWAVQSVDQNLQCWLEENVLIHCGCLFMDPDVLVLGTSTIVRGTKGTYNPLVRSIHTISR